MLHQFVIVSSHLHIKKPYGSWRDIKYLCKIIKDISPYQERSGFIHHCIRIANIQLRTDMDLYKKFSQDIEPRLYLSTVSKWIPRENKKFGWLYDMMVLDYFKHNQTHFLNNVDFTKDIFHYYRAVDNCRMIYRKMLSTLNKQLDTVEINYCDRKWDEISHKKTPVLALSRDKYRLLSYKWISKNESYQELILHLSKLICSHNLKLFFAQKYKQQKVSENVSEPEEYVPDDYMKYIEQQTNKQGLPSKVSIDNFVKQAMKLLELKKDNKHYEVEILNSDWKRYIGYFNEENLTNIIPLIDFSLIMSEKNYYSLYTAIGIACFITERNSDNKRVLCYDHQPIWVNLSECNDFFSMIETIYNATLSSRNTNSNLMESIKLISNAFVSASTPKKDIRKITFVVLSNFTYSLETNKKFTEIFTANGLEFPRIVYWNLSQEFQNELPVSLKDKRAFILSGNSIDQIYHVTKNHKKMNIYNSIVNILEIPRYQYLSDYIDKMASRTNKEN
jgi:hypothetical protein